MFSCSLETNQLIAVFRNLFSSKEVNRILENLENNPILDRAWDVRIAVLTFHSHIFQRLIFSSTFAACGWRRQSVASSFVEPTRFGHHRNGGSVREDGEDL